MVFGTRSRLSGDPRSRDATADAAIQGAAADDYSGDSVRGAGDVNGDGIDDLIIGAPCADPNGRDHAGASYVVFGTDQGFAGDPRPRRSTAPTCHPGRRG